MGGNHFSKRRSESDNESRKGVKTRITGLKTKLKTKETKRQKVKADKVKGWKVKADKVKGWKVKADKVKGWKAKADKVKAKRKDLKIKR
jgi:hypothetical protein